ncbi:MAG: type II toxin-antitoxin system VapC family toxin [Caulobacterales bacterium]
MPDEVVVDASVAAKVFITEVGSDAARSLASSGIRMLAPDLIFVELANVAVKRMRRGDISRDMAADLVASAPGLLNEVVPATDLTARAFALACDHGISTYDAMYVALAEVRGCQLITADLRLIAKASEAGLAVELKQP